MVLPMGFEPTTAILETAALTFELRKHASCVSIVILLELATRAAICARRILNKTKRNGNKMKPKLHEVLAIESSLENQANKVRTELASTFEKKRHLFEEKLVTFTPNGEGQQPVKEAQSDIQSTVIKELEWITPYLSKALDASYQVAETNTKARANVVLDDETVILSEVPATALLELEKRLVEVQTLVASIPTLDPAKGFSLDDSRGGDIYRAREVTKNRTQKTPKVLVKYEATKEHPAQTELLYVDLPVGTIREQEWSGLVTPATKADMLGRVEQLIRAVRRARSRANDAEVDTAKVIGKKLVNYLFNGK
jgi:hypothetical protein